MRQLIIGEGQIGQELIAAALGRGDEVTVLRRSAVSDADTRARYGDHIRAGSGDHIRAGAGDHIRARYGDHIRAGSGDDQILRIQGDTADPDTLDRALRAGGGADVVQATFHAPYDARIWRRTLPAAERVVLDAAARADLPVVFPESMYPFLRTAGDFHEGDPFAPGEAKGEVRVDLINARRAHPANTVSVVAADLIGPTSVGTWGSVINATVIEPLAAGQRPFLTGSLAAEHSLTHIPDLAAAMLVAGDHVADLRQDGLDGVVHAPTAPARTLGAVVDHVTEQLGARPRRLVTLPRPALRLAGLGQRVMYEIAAIGDLWYRDCRLHPGVLATSYGLQPTDWARALEASITAATSGQKNPIGHTGSPVS